MRKMKSVSIIICVIVTIILTMIPIGNAANLDMTMYYRGLGQDPSIIEKNDLLKAADDWRINIIPPGFSMSITTDQLLTLSDEWRGGVAGPTVVPTVSSTPVQLKTGTILKRSLGKGSGILEADNKINSDTVLSVTSPDDLQTALLKVYIRAGDTFKISDIPNGVYVLVYMSGKDWNSGTNQFNIIDEISRFDQSLEYSGGDYWTATLYPIVGGNAATTSIPASEFPI